MKRLSFCTLLLVIFWSCEQDYDPLTEIFKNDEQLREIAFDPRHEVQMIYTQIDRDENQRPTFHTFTFQQDSDRYFYPASTVKLPVALLALRELNRLKIVGLDSHSVMLTDSADISQSVVRIDSTAPGQLPTIAHYIRKILIASDNDAYNRLYEFLGQDEINEALRQKGYADTRIIHRLSLPMTPEKNLMANPVRFYEGDSLMYQRPLRVSSGRYHIEDPVLRGVGYIRGDQLVSEPFNFQYRNFFPLHEQHRLLQTLMFPAYFPDQRFELTEDQREFIYYNIALLPEESGIEEYFNKEEYWPSYVKFLLYGSDPDSDIPKNIRIFNKIGQAYGYLIDNAYIVDFDRKIEFMLSVIVHVNENQIYNDGIYEYDSVGFPFMARLGQRILEYEAKRARKTDPNLRHLEKLFE